MNAQKLKRILILYIMGMNETLTVIGHKNPEPMIDQIHKFVKKGKI